MVINLTDSIQPYISWIFTISSIGISVTTVGLILLYRNQNLLLYMPNPPGLPKTPSENPRGYRNPGEWNYQGNLIANSFRHTIPVDYEEQYLTTADGVKIHVWLVLQAHKPELSPTLIYFHGNAGNMGFRLPNAMSMYSKSKYNVVMMDYRGYGSSEGTPTEEGLNLDAECVLTFVTSHPLLQGSPIVLFGRSLGGAVSISLAAKHPSHIHGIILENTFLSISAMVDILMPWVRVIKEYVLCIQWNSDVKIQTLTLPILFISGDADQLVPPIHMKKLYDLAVSSSHRDFFNVSGGTHNDTWEVAGPAYYARLRAFAEVIFHQFGRAQGHLSDVCEVEEEEEDGEKSVGGNMLPTMGSDFVVRQ